ncbi:MAG: SufD family Fe-S cluster assembly protein [Paludibacteraceae bacterium]|nr:SufD family Fe-S cluster assembly protein [Paludibacteraceae bacterium]
MTYNISHNNRRDLVLINEPSRQLHFVQDNGSTLRLYLLCLPDNADNQPHNYDIEIEHNGEECTTEVYALCCIKGQEQAAIHTNIRHNKGGGKSKQLVKFVLQDQAQGEFYGELYIAPHAQQTSAEQQNRNILLSDNAYMRTRPQLEIYADDVKASHGASTGQLDQTALFYMQQRGIAPDKGRQLLLKAFMQDVVETIENEEDKQRSIDAIDRVIQHLY